MGPLPSSVRAHTTSIIAGAQLESDNNTNDSGHNSGGEDGKDFDANVPDKDSLQEDDNARTQGT